MAHLFRMVTTAAGVLVLLGPPGGVRGQDRKVLSPEVTPERRVMSGNAREAALGKALADPEKTNTAFKLIWLGCGPDDAAINGGRALSKVLKEKGVRHAWVESEGYRHDYQIGRIYLRDILPKLFRD